MTRHGRRACDISGADQKVLSPSECAVVRRARPAIQERAPSVRRTELLTQKPPRPQEDAGFADLCVLCVDRCECAVWQY
jgi:hypothetical protein